VMVPGWSQSAMEFKYQLTGLSDKYHVYASTCVAMGSPQNRTMGTASTTVGGRPRLPCGEQSGRGDIGRPLHGCSVIWGYWEQYGSDRLSKLILVDQMPMITSNPAWSPQELEDAGAIFDGKSLLIMSMRSRARRREDHRRFHPRHVHQAYPWTQ